MQVRFGADDGCVALSDGDVMLLLLLLLLRVGGSILLVSLHRGGALGPAEMHAWDGEAGVCVCVCVCVCVAKGKSLLLKKRCVERVGKEERRRRTLG